MTRRRDTARLTTIGIAIEARALRRSVGEVLAKSERYEAFAFDPADIAAGTWPRGRYAAVVATPGACRRRLGARRRLGYPVVLVVREDDLFRDRKAIAAADAFVLAERLDSLPSVIVLSAHRLSVMPKERAGRPLEIDERLRMLPQLSARDRAVLAELAKGSDNGAIASRLAISQSAAKACVRRVIGLLGFRSRAEAGVFAAALDLAGAGRRRAPIARRATKKK